MRSQVLELYEVYDARADHGEPVAGGRSAGE
jgi:hypothetical protein